MKRPRSTSLRSTSRRSRSASTRSALGPSKPGPDVHRRTRRYIVGTNRGVPLRADGFTDKGRVRRTNEDCFAIHGGARALRDRRRHGRSQRRRGRRALAVDAVVAFVTGEDGACAPVRKPPTRRDPAGPWPFGSDPSLSADGNLLRTAIHAPTCNRKRRSPRSTMPGWGRRSSPRTSATACLSVAHVGDSRLYLLAGGRLRQVTQDDSWMASMLAHDPGADPLLLEHIPCATS